MKIIDLDKLRLGDIITYRGQPAEVVWVREKDATLSVGVEVEDKSVCLAFSTASGPVTLTSRVDAKMDVGGRLMALDLSDYSQPATIGTAVGV